MPGKHAPASSKSFFLSLGAAVGGMLGALALVLALVLVALNAGGDNKRPVGSPAVSGSPTPTRTTSPSPTATATTTASPAQTLLPPSRVSLSVLNGTQRTGLAARFKSDAQKAGYPVTRTGNAPKPFAKSTIYYRPGAEEEALAFQKRFNQFTVIAALPAGYPSDVLLTVVLGADFP